MDNITHLAKEYILWPELQNDFQKNIHFGKTNMKDFVQEIKPFVYQQEPIQNQIALFYLTNEKLSKTRINSQDVLGVADLEDYQLYQDTLSRLSKELIAYITVCSLVEARHMNLPNLQNYWENFMQRKTQLSLEKKDNEDFQGLIDFSGSITSEFQLDGYNYRQKWNYIKSHEFGQEFLRHFFHDYFVPNQSDFDQFIDFMIEISSDLKNIFSTSSTWRREREDNDDRDRNYGYTEVATTFLVNNLNQFTLEETLTYLQRIFIRNSFAHDFGGLPWANIAAHGLNFVQGKMNAEMFIDQAFSLEHNNGNIFNKDFLFEESPKIALHYSINNSNFQNRENDFDNIPISQLFLNAQHLGILNNLFSISQFNKDIQAIVPLDLFQELQAKNYIHSNNDTSKENITQPFILKYTEQEFCTHFATIQRNYRILTLRLQNVETNLNTNYPQLLSPNLHDRFDFKEFFRNVSKNNFKYEDLFTAISEPNNEFFKLWNFIHNDIINPILKPHYAKPFSFHLHDLANLPTEAFDKNIIGGKAWSLVNMNQLALPVPKAKVFTTDCCFSYYNHREQFNTSLNNEINNFSLYLQNNTNDPILCSIRSGAPVSMPGMMDTILNVGIDDSNYDYFCNKMGKTVTDKCINKFIELFCSSRLNKKIPVNYNVQSHLNMFKNTIESYNLENPNNIILIDSHSIFPLNKEMQIKESLHAVFDSWHSERAMSYRTEKGISHDLGTAAIVQQMVFGNLNEKSCTGVVFSRDCLTGENKLVGEFLPKAQGEDVVSGSVTPFPIEQFKQFDPKSYNELLDIAKKLEQQTGQIQDIEFTVEDGKLYILQHRQAVCSPIANIKLFEDKSLDLNSLIKNIEPKNLQVSKYVVTEVEPCIIGLSANSGAMQGIVIRGEHDMISFQDTYNINKQRNPDFGWIFYAELTSPEHMPLMNKTHGFITEQGGFTSHAAIIARSLNKPCIVGLGGETTNRFSSGEIITIDATQGKIWHGEQPFVENTKLAKATAKILQTTYNINLNEIDHSLFQQRMKSINEKNKSWAFNFPNTHYVKNKPIKKDKFLNIGQKISLILAADQKIKKNQEKNKIILSI